MEFTALPPEILCDILRRLSIADRLKLACTCRFLRHFIKDQVHWNDVCIDFDELPPFFWFDREVIQREKGSVAADTFRLWITVLRFAPVLREIRGNWDTGLREVESDDVYEMLEFAVLSFRSALVESDCIVPCVDLDGLCHTVTSVTDNDDTIDLWLFSYMTLKATHIKRVVIGCWQWTWPTHLPCLESMSVDFSTRCCDWVSDRRHRLGAVAWMKHSITHGPMGVVQSAPCLREVTIRSPRQLCIAHVCDWISEQRGMSLVSDELRASERVVVIASGGVGEGGQ